MIFQVYMQDGDKERCEESLLSKRPTTMTGLGENGNVAAFTGVVKQVDVRQRKFPGYPLRVTLDDGLD